MKLNKFTAPGNLKEFNPQFENLWSTYISDIVDKSIKGYPDDRINDAPRDLFLNQTKTALGNSTSVAEIAWFAFPRNILIGTIGDKQRWQKADSSRDLQDEYCEWSVERNPGNGKITKVEFTCEDADYWTHLWAQSPESVVELYKAHVSSDVKKQDLQNANGSYDPKNKWNNNTTTGAMHMIQRNNTIGAAIELAAAASIVRVVNGRTLTGEQELIQCGQYGDEKRNSDPHIGAIVNSVTRQKAQVTLTDPIGLYFDGLITNGWDTPDQTNPIEFWKYTRGENEKFVRAVYEVPPNKNYVVGDVKINGKTIDFGSQIADFIKIKIIGVGTRLGEIDNHPMNACTAPKPQNVSFATVSDVLSYGSSNAIKYHR